MFRKRDKNKPMLDVTDPEVFDMLLKIIQERDYDIPDTFIKYITDEVFMSLITNTHITMENAEKLINKAFPHFP